MGAYVSSLISERATSINTSPKGIKAGDQGAPTFPLGLPEGSLVR